MYAAKISCHDVHLAVASDYPGDRSAPEVFDYVSNIFFARLVLFCKLLYFSYVLASRTIECRYGRSEADSGFYQIFSEACYRSEHFVICLLRVLLDVGEEFPACVGLEVNFVAFRVCREIRFRRLAARRYFREAANEALYELRIARYIDAVLHSGVHYMTRVFVIYVLVERAPPSESVRHSLKFVFKVFKLFLAGFCPFQRSYLFSTNTCCTRTTSCSCEYLGGAVWLTFHLIHAGIKLSDFRKDN